ncbi:hypothetical protein ACQ86G_19210 [Roseateles chitinivorans]|uniref:hypothetical protein n=1 Tax=Roseateles chitinivorans TaxID=2917965 RepID=UPI003D67A568
MTRWVREFENGAFRSEWIELTGLVARLDVDDQTVTSTVEELARLKKVIAFVGKMIESADLELTPRSVWGLCWSQTEGCLGQLRQYETSRSEQYLVAANDHADLLLSYVRPYMVAPEEAIEAMGAAVNAFSSQVQGYAHALQSQSSQTRDGIAAAAEQASSRIATLEEIDRRAKGFETYLFGGTGEHEAIEAKVSRLVSQIEGRDSEIQSLHTTLTSGPSSTVAAIADAKQQIFDAHTEIDALLKSVDSECKELGVFYDRIYGKRSDPDESRRESGLKYELDDRLNQLTTFEADHKKRHDTLFEKVEALLPGAASAGLASAYKTMKDSFSSSITWYTRAFYGALALLFLGGLAVVSDSFILWPLQVKLIQTHDWQEMIRTMLTRIPIILPLVWVAIFSATRRSQYERLQQEYAHKESLASSYESYKKQLQDLKLSTEELQQTLIAKAIEAIAYNASATLDGKHAEKPPAFQLLEKLSIDDIKKLLDLARQKSG